MNRLEQLESMGRTFHKRKLEGEKRSCSVKKTEPDSDYLEKQQKLRNKWRDTEVLRIIEELVDLIPGTRIEYEASDNDEVISMQLKKGWRSEGCYEIYVTVRWVRGNVEPTDYHIPDSHREKKISLSHLLLGELWNDSQLKKGLYIGEYLVDVDGTLEELVGYSLLNPIYVDTEEPDNGLMP